jgi:hypothetical protein
VWNARGTWYKEAERDLDKAERAYRKGLEKVGGSGLLMHNLAQVLVERAERGWRRRGRRGTSCRRRRTCCDGRCRRTCPGCAATSTRHATGSRRCAARCRLPNRARLPRTVSRRRSSSSRRSVGPRRAPIGGMTVVRRRGGMTVVRRRAR